jgi:PPM family protein phosphatase
MIAAYQTNQGLVRTNNEDSLLVDEDLRLFIVSDGLGGHNAGEVASSLAVAEIHRFVRLNRSLQNETRNLLKESLIQAHSVIQENSESNPQWIGMGATVVAALMDGNNFSICNAGDSRAYVISGADIRQVSRDHTRAAQLVSDGLMDPIVAKPLRNRFGITMALGIDVSLNPFCTTEVVESGQFLLLCSDGLTDMLDDEEIRKVVSRSASVNHACKGLVDAANRNGGRDNITVILIKV